MRGKFFEGTVVSDGMQKTVVVEWPRVVRSGKFNRFFRLTSRIKAKNLAEISARKGDRVRVEETRKLSKTVNFIVTKIIKRRELPKKTKGAESS
ncbi:MAG: 30S ribosomal protein S17 [archaeon]